MDVKCERSLLDVKECREWEDSDGAVLCLCSDSEGITIVDDGEGLYFQLSAELALAVAEALEEYARTLKVRRQLEADGKAQLRHLPTGTRFKWSDPVLAPEGGECIVMVDGRCLWITGPAKGTFALGIDHRQYVAVLSQ